MIKQTVLPTNMTMAMRQTTIHLGKTSLPLELTMPTPTIGWMILTQTSLDADQKLDQVRATFHRMNVATMTVYLGTPGANVKNLTERLLAATRWLQDQPESKGLPVSYFGTGEQTGVALYAAANQNRLSAIVSWNGQAFPSYRTLRQVATPSLLLVDEQSAWQDRWANRTAQWQMGAQSQFQLLPQGDFETVTFEWYKSNSRRSRASRPVAPLKRLLATGALAMALALPIAMPAIVQATPPQANVPTIVAGQTDADFDFSDGVALSVNDVQGDGFTGLANNGTAPSGRRQGQDPTKKGDGSYTLGAGDVQGDGFTPHTGEISLIDAGGLEFFVNTNITFTTSSSASAAASEATFAQPVAATTQGGGTVATSLSDAFDGYNGLIVNGVSYNNNGLVSLECIGPISNIERQIVYNPQTIGNLSVSRKVFVPDDDEFIRWINVITNTGAGIENVILSTSNNLGSDASTLIVTSSDGNSTGEATDNWITSFQNFSGTTSSDVRLGHVFQGPGAPVPLSAINFVDGADNPSWTYDFDLNPGETAIIMNFATGQPSRADTATQSDALANLLGSSLQCLTPTEIAQIVNFNIVTGTALSVSQTDSPDPVGAGQPLTYTVQVNNSGAVDATTVALTDTLPVGTTYQNASGAGWTCNEASGVVTCDMPSLASGAAATVTVQLLAPNSGATNIITNTVTTSAANANATTDVEPTLVFVPTDVSLTEFSGAQNGVAAAIVLTALAIPGLGWLIRRRQQAD
ncbi:MAG: DUF11 domain-containing protein [Candidatus Promineifilaceae bacterium]